MQLIPITADFTDYTVDDQSHATIRSTHNTAVLFKLQPASQRDPSDHYPNSRHRS